MLVRSFIWMHLLFAACGCSQSPQSAWQTQGWAEVALDLGVRLKLEMLWMALFLEYAFKMIQNIQWSTGEHWPWLHLSFINFVSVKWAWAREWSDYVTGAEPFIRETHQPCDSGSLVPSSFFCLWRCAKERRSVAVLWSSFVKYETIPQLSMI